MHIIEVNCPTYPLWEQIALPRAVAKIKADLLHCTSNTAPIYCPVPLILTLHDIIFWNHVKAEISHGTKIWDGIIVDWLFHVFYLYAKRLLPFPILSENVFKMRYIYLITK